VNVSPRSGLAVILALAATTSAALTSTWTAQAAAGNVAALAVANQGRTACGPDSLGGTGYETSCTGNGGQPEYWCADFVRWVWANSGLAVTGLTAAAASFITSGDGTVHTAPSYQPRVGDAVVYDYDGAGWAQHVAIITDILRGGAIQTENGDFGATGTTEAQFAGASTVQEVTLPTGQTSVGSVPAGTGMIISAYVTPPGLTSTAGQPAVGASAHATSLASTSSPAVPAAARTPLQVPGLSSLPPQTQAASAPVAPPPGAAITAAGTVTIADSVPAQAAPRRASISVTGWTTPAAAPITPRAAASQAAVPVTTPSGATSIFWAGPAPARNLYRATYQSQRSASATTQDLGGHLAAAPVVVTVAGQVSVIYQGTNGYLYLARWPQWAPARITQAGQASRVTLAAIAGPGGTITIAWTTPAAHLAATSITPAGTATTVTLAHGAQSAPALAGSPHGITAYYQGPGSTLWETSTTPGHQAEARNLHLPMGDLAGGQPTATTTPAGGASVFWTVPALASNLIQATISPAGQLTAVADLGGSLASAPAILTPVPGTISAVYWGTDGNLCEITSISGGSTWTTGIDLGRGSPTHLRRWHGTT
jgi:hypothetical protein